MEQDDLKERMKIPGPSLGLERPFIGPKGTTARVQAPKYIAEFDSGWGMLRALANCLSDKDFPGIGSLPGAKPVELLVGRLDQRLGQRVYAWTGWSETVAPQVLSSVRAEDISQAVVDLYPEDSYDALMIGASNGAALHLCAALRAPWLPHTFLIPVSRPSMDPDHIARDMGWGRERGEIFLKNNSELMLYHMHDPDHDRLMVRRMAYFRVKRRSLGETYRRFLEEKLRPNATIYLIDCRLKWPSTQVGERHFFQLGGAGGVPAEEYLHGSERVTRFLEQQGSRVRQWRAPAVDAERPEAEWGFQPELGEEAIQVARRLGHRVVRIIFEDPQDISPLVADFYRRWYQSRGVESSQVLAESFILLDPFWALRTGSVPFWMLFNGKSSADAAKRYLTNAAPYDYVYVMLLSNGIAPIEGTSIEDWRSVLRLARVRGEFIGVDEERFPYDFASFLRYNAELKNKIASRYDMPEPATVQELEAFVARHGHRYRVRFEEVGQGDRRTCVEDSV
jgi:hypothetical protein